MADKRRIVKESRSPGSSVSGAAKKYEIGILDEACRTIPVRYGDRSITVPMAQVIIRSLAVNTAKGQHRSQRLLAKLLLSTERASLALDDACHATAITYNTE